MNESSPAGDQSPAGAIVAMNLLELLVLDIRDSGL